VEVPSRFEISDELWAEIEPLIPVRQRRARYPGRKAIEDRLVLNGILHVLHTGIAWEDLPAEAFGCSYKTCLRRLTAWSQIGLWSRLHRRFLARLRAANQLDWSRAVIDTSSVKAPLGGQKPARIPRIAAAAAASCT
jgi:transposase